MVSLLHRATINETLQLTSERVVSSKSPILAVQQERHAAPASVIPLSSGDQAQSRNDSEKRPVKQQELNNCWHDRSLRSESRKFLYV